MTHEYLTTKYFTVLIEKMGRFANIYPETWNNCVSNWLKCCPCVRI